MLLITSAFPHLKRFDENGQDVGPELVARCVRSWQDNGFRVLSVHNRAEEAAIGVGLPGVSYRFIDEPLPEDARLMPTLAAVLDCAPSNDPVAIINADIFMVPVPGLAGRLAAAAREATLLMHRWDVPSLTRREGRCFDIGVDFLAFTPARIAPAIEELRTLPYQIGVPWWDYALPLAASLYAPLSVISDPLLLHHWHQLGWNEQEWHRFANITETFLAAQACRPDADPTLAAEFRRRLHALHLHHAADPDRLARDYALDDMARHLLHTISGHHAISLVAEMRLLPRTGQTEEPWTLPSPKEMAQASQRQASIAGALALEGTDAVVEVGSGDELTRSDESASPIGPALTRLAADAPMGAIMSAGLADFGQVAKTFGKLLERRLRHWRRKRRTSARSSG